MRRGRGAFVILVIVPVMAAALTALTALGGAAAQSRQEPRFAAVPSEKGGQDIFGGYEVVPNWPKPLSSLPGHEKWTYGAGQSVFAESPNRVFVLQRGELPNLPRPMTIKLPQLGPNIEFPNFRLPWRDATVASPPGRLETPDGKVGDDSDVGKDGVEFKWEHCILVVDANGNITEDWTQWDKMLRRPHAVYISPYDPEKRVWIVDDYRHSIFVFSNDGKRLLQTIGEPNVHAADDKHFYRPTFMAWLPDGTFFVADGYANTRVVKFDKNGKYLMTWGQAGKAGRGAPPETRPGYMNNVHGIAVDPMTWQVLVNDRQNHRVQVFDENGKYLREWSFGPPPSDIHLFIITADRYLWAADRGTSKMLKYDLNGNFLYSWGTWGDFPGGMWGVHGLSTDQDGNFYVAEVDSGRAQKYRPRPGANPAFLVGKPVAAVWK
jgi:DNA-binding beta-propeller fold protein YncE